MPRGQAFARPLSRDSYSVSLMVSAYSGRKSLMTDLGAIGIVLACFALFFAFLYALDRV
jgi:hypothetical protein